MTYAIKPFPKHEAFRKAIVKVCGDYHESDSQNRLNNLEIMAILSIIIGQTIGLCAGDQETIDTVKEAINANINQGIKNAQNAMSKQPDA